MATIRQTITRSRFGWYCRTTHGIGIVGEVPLFAWTRRGIERKAARLAHRLADADERNASVIIKTYGGR